MQALCMNMDAIMPGKLGYENALWVLLTRVLHSMSLEWIVPIGTNGYLVRLTVRIDYDKCELWRRRPAPLRNLTNIAVVADLKS